LQATLADHADESGGKTDCTKGGVVKIRQHNAQCIQNGGLTEHR
jgi:hypothetical protein